MATIAVDTSVIVASLLTWHDHHDRAWRCLEPLLDSDDELLLPLPALVEAYTVMTRLPSAYRLAPEDAFSLLAGSLRGRGRVVQLNTRNAWRFLEGLAQGATSGGRTYDAHIIACAVRAGADRILTFNTRDFERLVSPEIEVVAPQEH